MAVVQGRRDGELGRESVVHGEDHHAQARTDRQIGDVRSLRSTGDVATAVHVDVSGPVSRRIPWLVEQAADLPVHAGHGDLLAHHAGALGVAHHHPLGGHRANQAEIRLGELEGGHQVEQGVELFREQVLRRHGRVPG